MADVHHDLSVGGNLDTSTQRLLDSINVPRAVALTLHKLITETDLPPRVKAPLVDKLYKHMFKTGRLSVEALLSDRQLLRVANEYLYGQHPHLDNPDFVGTLPWEEIDAAIDDEVFKVLGEGLTVSALMDEQTGPELREAALAYLKTHFDLDLTDDFQARLTEGERAEEIQVAITEAGGEAGVEEAPSATEGVFYAAKQT